LFLEEASAAGVSCLAANALARDGEGWTCQRSRIA